PEGQRLAGPPHPGLISTLAFSEDGRWLALASDRVRVWDVDKNQFITPELPHPDQVWGLAFSRRGDNLATACGDDKCRLYSVPSAAGVTGPQFAPFPHDARQTPGALP